MDKSNLLKLIGTEGAKIGVLAVGGHQHVLQRGGGTYLHHNRSVPKFLIEADTPTGPWFSFFRVRKL